MGKSKNYNKKRMDDDRYIYMFYCKLGHAGALPIDVWHLNLWLFHNFVYVWYYLGASDVFEC